MALFANLALCDLHKWHFVHNWHCLDTWHCMTCTNGIVFMHNWHWLMCAGPSVIEDHTIGILNMHKWHWNSGPQQTDGAHEGSAQMALFFCTNGIGSDENWPVIPQCQMCNLYPMVAKLALWAPWKLARNTTMPNVQLRIYGCTIGIVSSLKTGP